MKGKVQQGIELVRVQEDINRVMIHFIPLKRKKMTQPNVTLLEKLFLPSGHFLFTHTQRMASTQRWME